MTAGQSSYTQPDSGVTGRPSDSSPAATLTGRAPEADALLCDPRRAWIVEEGEVALFVVQLEGGSALAWEPIGRLQRGGLLGGVAVGKRAGLVARVPADARLRGVWLDRPNGARLAEPIDRWLAYAFGVLDSRLAPGRAHPLLRSRRERSAMQLPIQMLQVGVPAQPLQDMQIAIPPGSDTWVAVRAGTVRLLGPERSRQLGTGEISPVGDAEWLLSEGDAAVSVHTTRDVVVAGTFGDGLRNLSDDLLHAVVRRLEKVEATERARQQELSARDQRTIDGVVHDFRAVLDRRIADLGGLDEGPVFVAARIVGAHLGVEIRSPGASAEHGPKSDAISKIARASRLRTRQVTLEGRWWRHDHGPLIGGLREGNLAVALIPGRRGYRLHDPVNGERRRVDAKQAARLLPTARELYPPMPARPLSARDVVRFAAAGARSDLRTMGFAALAVAVLGLLVPIMTGEILGTLVPHAERSRITELCLLLLVSALVSAMLNMVFNLAALRIEGRLDHRLQSGIWDRMLALPANFFGDYSTGELGTAVMGVSQARETLTGVSFQAGLAAVVIVADLVLIAVLDLRLLLAGLVILTIAIGVAVVAGRRQLRHQYGSYEFEKEVNSRTYQLITGVAKVATAGAQARGFAHWGSVFATMRRHTFAARAVQNRMAAFSASLTLWGAIVAFFVVGDVVTVSVSTFLIFNVAYFQVLASLQQITSTALTMIETVPSLQSLEPLMQAVPETVDQRQDAGRLSGAISLEHVTFGYSDAGRPALDDVSFSVAPGEFVAIVGPSGSGKSTLVRLLLAFESPERGTILYDDQDLGNLDPTSVRRQCGVVLQDTQLYAGDILNNIIGTGLYSYDDAWEALTMCGLDAEVSEMPMGMYTMLSDAGAGLSGGQRQRLLLARALVTRPSVLILDEATSALDNRTQQQVMESMSGFDATRIVVAHRLSTIRDADRIIVLDEGRLVQQGRYEELIDVEGVFRDLAQRQLA